MKRLLYMITFIASSWTGLAENAQAQTLTAGWVTVQGFTLQKDSLSPAPFVTITNARSRFATISEDNGFFTTQALRGDTLEFTAVNLERVIYVVPKYYASDRVAVRAVMPTKTYVLQEVTVRPYSEKQFKKDLLALKLPDNDPDLQLPEIPKLATMSPAAQNGTGIGVGISGPLTALYDKFSREGKSKRKLAQMMSADNRKKMYAAKMNRDFVGRVTGLKNQDLTDFMTYCKLSETEVIEFTEYDLALALQICLKSFRAERN